MVEHFLTHSVGHWGIQYMQINLWVVTSTSYSGANTLTTPQRVRHKLVAMATPFS